MKTLTTLTLAAVAAIGIGSSALATDLYIAPVDEYVAPANDGFDWEGFYAGVYKGTFYDGVFYYFRVGGVVGYNAEIGDNVVVGVEKRLGAVFNGGGYDYNEFEALARIGFEIGDNVLLYKAVGAGIYFCCGGDSSDWFWSLGPGVEVAVGDQVSIRGEVFAHNYFGDSGIGWLTLQAGAVWHFN